MMKGTWTIVKDIIPWPRLALFSKCGPASVMQQLTIYSFWFLNKVLKDFFENDIELTKMQTMDFLRRQS